MTDRPIVRSLFTHVAIALLAVLLFYVLHRTAGRMPIGGGEGYDGHDYAEMLRGGWIKGSVYTRLRPLVVWMNQPAFSLTGDAVRAFDLMNFVYAGAFAFLLSLMMERYGASGFARALAIVCLGLSNASKLPAYYPVLIDLGAFTIMAFALWAMLAAPRWVIALACVAAILSREFAPVVIFFGVHRDLRLRRSWMSIILTYLPAALVYLVLRVIVAKISTSPGNSLEVFITNRVMWKDPMFVALYAYFALTFLGGISLITAAQAGRCWRLLRDEPEWISFALPIAVVSGLVGMDIWRYLVSLAPLVLVLYARCSRDWSRGEALVWGVAAIVLTVWTQEPFVSMNLTGYFTDWFPYYAWTGNLPSDVFVRPLWPEWAWRFLVVAFSLCALIVYAKTRPVAGVVVRA